MLNNIRGILNRRSESQSKSPEGSRIPSEDDTENAGSMEGFLCPSCKLRFPAPEDLQDHYESIHSERELVGEGRVYNCSVCKMRLGSEIELKSHYVRHHSNKDDTELESMVLQVKALEEGKALLQGELQAVRTQSVELSKDCNKIRDERDKFKLEATKLTDDLAALKQEYDELKSAKSSLESTVTSSRERIKKLEVEMHQRPEADDVSVLQKELVAVQKMMNDLTLQREAEKDLLQAQCNSTKETCLKLQAEKTSLENLLSTCPKKEDVEKLNEKISSLSNNVSQMEKEVNNKETERKRLQNELDKCSNYVEINAKLSDKTNMLEDVQRLSAEKDVEINKLKIDMEKAKKNIEEMKVDRDELFSKIEGDGANAAAMSQLREENAKLEEQILMQQQVQEKTATQHKSEKEDLRSSLKLVNSELSELKQKYSEAQSQLTLSESRTSELISESKSQNEALAQKENIIKDFNQKIDTLVSSETSNKSLINELRNEIEHKKELLEQKSSQIDGLKEQIKDEKVMHEKRTAHLELEKQNFEKRLAEVGNTLPKVQADLLDRENRLKEAEKQLRKVSDKLGGVEKERAEKESELLRTKQLLEELLAKMECLEKTVADYEAAKVEFCDTISNLNEDKLRSQLKESELTTTIEVMQQDQSQLNEKCMVLEEENQSLRSSNTAFQNEKNCLLNTIEGHKRSLSDLNGICTVSERKIVELTETFQKTKTEAEKVLKEASIEKEVYLKDKLKLQKQIENLEIDCAKQLSESQKRIESLEQQVEDAEERNNVLKSSLEAHGQQLRSKDSEREEREAHHTAQLGVLTQNIQTLREDLLSEQRRRETAEGKLDEVCGNKLELEAKLENALDERKELLERCLKTETEAERLQKTSADTRRKYDDCVAALQELGRENQSLQVENMKLTNRKWVFDNEVTHCTTCGKLFTVTNRKHHCRNCGGIFCHECSAKTATVVASKDPLRVCDTCYDELSK